MTKFSYEVPLNHLEDFDKYQDLYFALSFLCRENGDYFSYIKSKAKKKRVILDNSFNELGKPDNPIEMAATFEALEADMVVSPDSDEWSIDLMQGAYRELTKWVDKSKVLVVVRSLEEYNWARDETGPYFCTTFYHRPLLAEHIKTLCYHFLGLLNPWEIRRYNPISCDTSIPIKLALRDLTMNDWMSLGCPHYHTKDIPDFFSLKLSTKELDLARRNCEWIRVNLAL